MSDEIEAELDAQSPDDPAQEGIDPIAQHGAAGRTIIDAVKEHMPRPEIQGIGIEGMAMEAIPVNFRFGLRDLERYDTGPTQVRSCPEAHNAVSFIHYMNSFAVDGTVVYASFKDGVSLKGGSSLKGGAVFNGIIDHYQKDETAWGNHRIHFRPEYSSVFKAWHSLHNEWITQREFAEFLDDHAEDVFQPDDKPDAPDPADMMELAQRFSAIKSVDFQSVNILSNGERQITYAEKVSESGTGGAGGSVKAPKTILIRAAVFDGQDPLIIGVKFAFDVVDANLRFRIRIHRLEQLIEGCFDELCQEIADGLPDGCGMMRGAFDPPRLRSER